MNQEEKFDRSIRNILREDLVEQPTVNFTNKVMEHLGLQRVQPVKTPKPLLSSKAKIAIAAGYLLVIALIILFVKGGSATVPSYLEIFTKFKLPTLGSLIQVNSQILTMLVVLMTGGWILAGIDRLLKKIILR